MSLSREDVEYIFFLNLGAVHMVAQKYYGQVVGGGQFEYDELFDAGCTGLLHAVNNYDASHSSKAAFVTYAYYWIRHRIASYIQQNNSRLINVPMYERKNVKYSFTSLDLIDQIHSMDPDTPADFVEKKYEKEQLLDFLRKVLSPHEFLLICLRFGIIPE